MGSAGKYIAKPVEVEAYHFDGTNSELYLVIGWVLANGGQAWLQPGSKTGESDMMRLEVPEGIVVVNSGDWVIRDAQGIFRQMSNTIFKTTYSVIPPEE